MKFQFDTIAEFFAMGGHATYVWGAYGVSLLLMVWLVARPLVQHAGVLNSLRRGLKKDQSQHSQNQQAEDS